MKKLEAVEQNKPFTVIGDVQDLERIIKLQLLLLGDATDRSEIVEKNSNKPTREEIEQLIDANPEMKEHITQVYRMASKNHLKLVSNEGDKS